MTESWREVRLPADLCGAAEQKYEKHFASLEDLVTFVLRALVNDEAAEMDRVEARIIEERLRSLGYLEPAG
jgi:hypothetical protein